jgi:uncharacterized repeat protein (TIGR03806 family)
MTATTTRAIGACVMALAWGCGHGGSAPCTSPGSAGVDSASSFPATLDAFCMVSIKNATVVPHDDTLVPYDLNTTLFSDYAVKYRTVWMPKGAAAAYADAGRLALPVGTVITKSFGFPADFRVAGAPVKWVETRVLVNTKDSGWTGASYTWNDAQTQATLTLGGEVVPESFIDTTGTTQNAHYLVPSQSQCRECHANDGTMTTLGPSAAQLNRDYEYSPTLTENELVHWSKAGLLTGAPDPSSAPALPVWDDAGTGDVQSRARAYLDANCSYCHNGQGEARTTGLVLTYANTDPSTVNTSTYGVCKSPVAAGKASAGQQYDVVPGHPEQSILVYRMQATEPSVAMPQLGRSLEHTEAVQLVSDWITGLPGSCP